MNIFQSLSNVVLWECLTVNHSNFIVYLYWFHVSDNSIQSQYKEQGSSWSWWHGSWMCSYLCSQRLSPLTLWSRIPSTAGRWFYLDFIRILRFPPPIKLTATINWNILESSVKHHNPYPNVGLILVWYRPSPVRTWG